ncbi:MAG TPA: leucyl/phenylalanyl-tRNA--protein transferase [Micavibrio sp.]|jgi:leucyl/phenylalanyl-tRNA--protein transferase
MEDVPLKIVLNAYCNGYFAMGGDDGEIRWHNPEIRAIIPAPGLHVSRSLRSLILKNPYEIRIDAAFDDVVAGCAERRPDRWITEDIQVMFSALHKIGYAHSVECWKDDVLVGGVYGLALGGAFCAESMFSRESNASKVALAHLCARLEKGGFTLIDCQILNDHTRSLGAVEIPGRVYLNRLHEAIRQRADFSLRECGPVDERVLIWNYLGNRI